MRLSDTERRVLSQLAQRLRSELEAQHVWLYGSAARGELQAQSDIDLLVVLPTVDWEIEKRVIDCCFDSELQLDRIVSPTCVTERDLTQSPLRASPFLHNAQRDAAEL